MPRYNEIEGAWEPDDSEIDAAAERGHLLKMAGMAAAHPHTAVNQILFHPDLADREFGSHLLSVQKLTNWAENQGLEIATQPPVANFQFVQVEALLCAVERAAAQTTSESMAVAIVQETKHLANSRAAEVAPRWLVGADAHQQWRRLLEKAVEAGELTLLHFGSKLPVQRDRSAEPMEAMPASAGDEPEIPWHMLATADELCRAFGVFTGMETEWFNNLKDKPELKKARFRPGEGGRSGRGPLFYVYPVLQWLISSKRRAGKPMSETTGWRMLKTHFPRVYEAYESSAPDLDGRGKQGD